MYETTSKNGSSFPPIGVSRISTFIALAPLTRNTAAYNFGGLNREAGRRGGRREPDVFWVLRRPVLSEPFHDLRAQLGRRGTEPLKMRALEDHQSSWKRSERVI